MSVEVVGDHISRSSPGGKSSETTGFGGATYTEYWSSAICGPLDRLTGCLTQAAVSRAVNDDDVRKGSLIPVATGNNHLTTVRRRVCPGSACTPVGTGPGSRQA